MYHVTPCLGIWVRELKAFKKIKVFLQQRKVRRTKLRRAILKRLNVLLSMCCLIGFAWPALGESITGAMQDSTPLPSYGTGKARLYTDYFCSPCRAFEPELKPLLVNLVKLKKIAVTFVDIPMYKDSLTYARYFLYAINKSNNLEYAIRTRSALFEAALTNISGKDALEEFLKGRGIAYAPFDAVPVLRKMNTYLQEERVTSTPNCVITKDGKSEKKVGAGEIVKALKKL